MGRHPKEYQQFDHLMTRLLAVPRSTLESRMERYREQSRAKPVRPGPNPKPTGSSSAASRIPADDD